MTAEPMVFDPEVEGLLREIAQDPSSSLLRVTRPQSVMGLFERTERVSPGMAGLSSAERQLVKVYRAEVAYLLREACKWRLTHDESIQWYVNRFGPSNSEARVGDAENIVERAQQLAADVKLPDGLGRVLLLCERGVERGPEPTVSALAIAAHRLEPEDSSRTYLGLGLTFEGKPRAALSIYGRLLDRTVSAELRAVVLSNMASVLETIDRPFDSIRYLSRADQASAEWTTPSMERLFCALKVGAREEALSAATCIDEKVQAEDSSFAWYLDSISSRKRSRNYVPSVEATALARVVIEHHGSAAGGIANVFV